MSIWKDHGTKIMGAATAALGTIAGAVTVVDPSLVTAVAGPKYGAYFALLAALAGAAFVKRGYTNSANLAAPGAPPMTTMTTGTK